MPETLTVIGSNGRRATVVDNALSVRSRSDFEKAIEDGDAYSWSSLTYNARPNDTLLAVENNSSELDLHIQEIHIQIDIGGQFIVHTQAGVTMGFHDRDGATGLITGVNLNRSVGYLAPATAYDNENGNTGVQDMYPGRLITGICAQNGNVVLLLDGCIILPNDHMIGVDVTANSASTNVVIIGYFKGRN